MSGNQRRPQKRSKYGSTFTVVDNIKFRSRKEARRYQELRLLERAGEITHLCLQPRFNLFAAGPLDGGWRDAVHVGVYIADFQYRDQTSAPLPGVTVVEDVKGMKTPLYKLKKKLAEACNGIQIREV